MRRGDRFRGEIFSVGSDEIGRGVRARPETCPVALAGTKHFGYPVEVFRGGMIEIALADGVSYVRGGIVAEGKTKRERNEMLNSWVKAFDENKDVEPMEVEILGAKVTLDEEDWQ